MSIEKKSIIEEYVGPVKRVSFEKYWDIPRKCVSSSNSAMVPGCFVKVLVVPAWVGERWKMLMFIHSSFIASVSNILVLPSLLNGEHYVLCTFFWKNIHHQVNPKKGTYLPMPKKGSVSQETHTLCLYLEEITFQARDVEKNILNLSS